MQKAIFPEEIDIADQAIVILWDDGHRSPYPHRFLRLRCPCAGCIDEMSGRPRLDPDQVPQDVHAVEHMSVGNYGMQFLWSDTHYTGIYTYRMLRSICTCISCNNERGNSEPGNNPRSEPEPAGG